MINPLKMVAFGNSSRHFCQVMTVLSLLIVAFIVVQADKESISSTDVENSAGNVSSIALGQRQLQSDSGTIIGGTNPPLGTYPFMVWFPYCCSGTLIRHDMVLTAASCISCMKSIVLLGGTDIGSATEYEIAAKYPHPKYKSIFQNNIAIVKLKCSSNKTRIPVNYNRNLPRFGSDVSIAGFGETTYNTSDIFDFGKLHVATVKTFNNTECRTRLNTFFDGNELVCAGLPTVPNGGVGGSFGDGGGPLILSMTQVGVSSWGRRPFGTYPGVYTRVATHTKFIKDTIKKHSAKKFIKCEDEES